MGWNDLMEMEESFWKGARDADFYQEHFAANRRIDRSMGIFGKEGVLATMSDAEPWDRFDIHDPSLIQVGDANSDGYETNMLSVSRENDGDWQLVLHQQTPADRS